jgi:hypothetical protein
MHALLVSSVAQEDHDEVKRPAYQWYPGDFRRDVALQACSFEARALWREMLDLMHDGEPYGHLTAGGVPMNDATVARIVGVPLAKARRWLADLEAHKVFSRTEAGVIFSRRMVKDEHIRGVRAESGKKGGNPALLDNQPAIVLLNQTDKQKPTPAVAVAVAVAKESSSSSSADVARLLDGLPTDTVRLSWRSEIDAARQGMHGQVLTDEQIAEACRDYVGNGHLASPNMRHFRKFLESAGRPPRPSDNGDSFSDGLARWKAETDEREAKEKANV